MQAPRDSENDSDEFYERLLSLSKTGYCQSRRPSVAPGHSPWMLGPPFTSVLAPGLWETEEGALEALKGYVDGTKELHGGVFPVGPLPEGVWFGTVRCAVEGPVMLVPASPFYYRVHNCLHLISASTEDVIGLGTDYKHENLAAEGLATRAANKPSCELSRVCDIGPLWKALRSGSISSVTFQDDDIRTLPFRWGIPFASAPREGELAVTLKNSSPISFTRFRFEGMWVGIFMPSWRCHIPQQRLSWMIGVVRGGLAREKWQEL